MSTRPIFHAYSAPDLITCAVEFAGCLCTVVAPAQGAACRVDRDAHAGDAASRYARGVRKRTLARHPDGVERVCVAVSDGQSGNTDRIAGHLVDAVSTPQPRKTDSGSGDALLTAIAQQQFSFAHLVEETPVIPTDGTIPQEVLEKAVHHRWALPRAWREYLKLSKQEVAARANISDRRYGELEVGFLRLSPRNKRKIANGLTLQTVQLLA